MLKSLQFQNFKSWKNAKVNCAPITGLFGTNSSGKTSIIQFLLMLKQTKDGTDRAISLDLNGDWVSLGTISDALHQHDNSLTLNWNAEFELDSELSISDASRHNAPNISKSPNLSINSSIIVQNGAPKANKLSYGLGSLEFSLVARATQSSQFDLSCQKLSNDAQDFRFVRTQGRAWGLPGPIKSYAFPDQARTYFQNAAFLADLESAYENQLDKIYYLGPLREYPQRDYLWTRSRPTDVGRRGEKAIDAILAATEAKETRNLKAKGRHRSFQETIAYWLKHMGLIEEFRVEEIGSNSNRWQAKVKTKKGSSEVLLTDVGFGISQVLPVVTLLQYVPEGATVILEQPEIHLHPLAQAELADVIIQAATHRKVQVILESHSEHLLLRLQRRIAEGAIENSEVHLYFCDAPSGESTITRLEVDLLGSIKNWPNKFMGDAFNETAEAEIAKTQAHESILMPKYVIDTNVPIVANGADPNISIECRLASIKLLQKALQNGKVFLDAEGLIQDEYRKHLDPKGQPGVGDLFYREVLNSHPDKIERVEIERRADGEYKDLPQPIIDAEFDRSDRKFAALAKRTKAPVYNAIDTDWVEKRAIIEASGIVIEFLCGCDRNLWRNAR